MRWHNKVKKELVAAAVAVVAAVLAVVVEVSVVAVVAVAAVVEFIFALIIVEPAVAVAFMS
jgi:hypothetical protein